MQLILFDSIMCEIILEIELYAMKIIEVQFSGRRPFHRKVIRVKIKLCVSGGN